MKNRTRYQCLLLIVLGLWALPFRVSAGEPESAKSYSPHVDRSCPTRVYWGDTHLHTDNSLKFLTVNLFENIFIIYFTSCGFITSRIISNLEVSNFPPCHIDIRDQVSFGYLLMIQII